MRRDVNRRPARCAHLALTACVLFAASVLLPGRAAAQGRSFACIAGANDMNAAAQVRQRYGARSPDSTWQRWRGKEFANNLLVLHDSVVQYWRDLAPAVPFMQQGVITARLDSLRAELNLANAPGGPRLRRFVVDVKSENDVEYFQLFEDTLDQRAIVRSTDPDAMRLAMCGTVHLARLVANLAGDSLRTAALPALQQRATRWENFEQHGQSMTPLELAVNTWCTACRNRAQLEPPHVQFMVGHISPAFEINEWRTRGATGREALMVEWIGVLRYTGNRRHHYGVSLLSSFPSGGPSGLGAALRWSRLGHVGIVWPREKGSRNYATVLSIDLYRFIASGKLGDKRELAKLITSCTSGTTSCEVPSSGTRPVP